MLRRGLAVLVVLGAMGAWGASSAAAQVASSTNLSLMICPASGECEVVPIIDQPHNPLLDTVLSQGLHGAISPAVAQCPQAGPQEIPLGNGGKLVVCPRRDGHYELRQDLLTYVAPDGQQYSVGSWYWYGMCETRHRIGVFTGDGYNDRPVVGIAHGEYPCTA